LKNKPPVKEDMQDMGIQVNQQDAEILKGLEVFVRNESRDNYEGEI
jgi:hypothetical protein